MVVVTHVLHGGYMTSIESAIRINARASNVWVAGDQIPSRMQRRRMCQCKQPRCRNCNNRAYGET